MATLLMFSTAESRRPPDNGRFRRLRLAAVCSRVAWLIETSESYLGRFDLGSEVRCFDETSESGDEYATLVGVLTPP